MNSSERDVAEPGYDIKVIDSNTVGAYPFEDMADGPDVSDGSPPVMLNGEYA